MLTDKLREGAQGRVFKVLFWIIILSFIFAGVGNYLIPKLNTDPVKVGQYSIKSAEWTEQYNQRTQMMMKMYGSHAQAFLEDPKFVHNLRMQVLDSMIDNVALNSQTFENGIRIGDEQVKDAISNDKRFYKDGKFNNELFLASVRNIGSSPDYYAEQLRTSLMTDTLVSPVIRNAQQPLPYELDNLANLFAQTRKVDMYSLNPEALKNSVKVSDDEALKFYESNHNLFMKPENAVFTYVVLSVDDLKKTVDAPKEKLEEYYRLNQDEFTVAQMREASQILIKPADDMKAKAEKAYAELKSGADFSIVAKEYSDDPDFETSHGSLGTVSRGTLSQALDKALFELSDVGAVSKIIYDNYGAHILRLDGILAEHVPDFKEIEEQVKKRYVDSKALALYNEKSATLTDISFENPDSLDAAAQACGVKVLNSGVVSAGDTSLAWPLNNADIQRAAFNEENRTSHVNSNVINLGDSACAVINVSEYHEAMLQKFDDVKEKAQSLALESKLQNEANNILTAFAKALKGDANTQIPENVSKKSDVLVTRSEANSDPMFVQDIYAIVDKAGDFVVSKDKGLPTLVILKEVSLDKENTLDNYKTFIRPQLSQYKASSTEGMLYQGARELTEISYNDDAIKLVEQQDGSAN